MRKGANTTSDKWLVVTCEHHFNIKPELTKLTNESIRVITNKSVLVPLSSQVEDLEVEADSIMHCAL